MKRRFGYGLCWCGCGEVTAIAKETSRSKRWIKGKPIRYVDDHQNSSPMLLKKIEARNAILKYPPSICQCGCGNTTTIAKATNYSQGTIKGKPYLYCRGHRKGYYPVSDEGLKFCPSCNKVKNIFDFSERKQKPQGKTNGDGYQSHCRRCSTDERLRWLRNNPESKRKAHYRHTFKKYGLTQSGYEKKSKEQNGLCAICQRPETKAKTSGKVERLSIDHDHNSGKVRELLCSRCNSMLAFCNENVDTLKNAIKYLEKHN